MEDKEIVQPKKQRWVVGQAGKASCEIADMDAWIRCEAEKTSRKRATFLSASFLLPHAFDFRLAQLHTKHPSRSIPPLPAWSPLRTGASGTRCSKA